MLSAFFLLSSIVLGGALIQMFREKEHLQQALHKYASLASQEETERQLDLNICLKQDEINHLLAEQEQLSIEISNLQKRIYDLQEEECVQVLGFYNPQCYFPDSNAYRTRLKQIKLEQKRMEDNDEVIVIHRGLTMNGDAKQGQKLTKSYAKLVFEAFKSECKSAIVKVNFSNLSAQERSIKNKYKRLNTLSEIVYLEIRKKYLELWVWELHLTYELKVKEQEEKEQRRINDDQRKQEDRERREIEKAVKEAEAAAERERRYQQDLEKAEKALQERALISEKERNQLEAEVQNLKNLIAKATGDRERATSRSKMIKSGVIYVLSNTGSLGRDVYRICMTKSSKPDDYVREMTPIVPFPFDIHFRIESEDASDTLERLRTCFSNRRVNLINGRREFFRVSFDEINQAIDEIAKQTGVLKNIHCERVPEAYEYRRTVAAERRKGQDVNSVSSVSDLLNETA